MKNIFEIEHGQQTYWSKAVAAINNVLKRLGKPLAQLELRETGNGSGDAVLTISGKKRIVEFKENITPSRYIYLKKILAGHDVILLTQYISPPLGELLVADNVEYCDAVGNMHLCDADRVILIQNCAKPKALEQKNDRGRAWTPAGLKVVFLLLTEPDAIAWSYRKLAEYSGVSLGSVKYIVADLKNQGDIIELAGGRRWGNRDGTLQRWVAGYLQRLLPGLPTRRYHGGSTLPDKKYLLTISGETFAARAGLLQSDKLLLYRCGNINECIVACRWQPDAAGNIEVRDAFWPPTRNFDGHVPYLLVYADLLAENDSRCADAAAAVYERYLREQK